MAEDTDASPFLEILCKSSGKIRRFGKGTESQFALKLINQKLLEGEGAPLATYIEAVKDEEEPVSFGPSCILIDYGDGWKLQTATNEGFENVNGGKVIDEKTPTVGVSEREKRVRKASVRRGSANVSATFPNPEPLSLIEQSYASDGEQHKHVTESFIGPDMTEAFTTTTIFAGSQELVDWCKKAGLSVGVVVVIGKSDHSGRNRRPRVKLVCDRSGVYKPSKSNFNSNSNTRTRNVVSKKCDCPFTLKGYQRNGGSWEMTVVCGSHNHAIDENLKGPTFPGKLRPEEEAVVAELSQAGAKPRHVLKVLKRRFPDTQASKGNVYNYRKKHKLAKPQDKLEGEVVEEPLSQSQERLEGEVVGEPLSKAEQISEGEDVEEPVSKSEPISEGESVEVPQ